MTEKLQTPDIQPAGANASQRKAVPARGEPPFFSEKYDDIYFSQADPEAEKQFVFVDANRISQRIAQSETFVVGELGFGFGLNYALTLRAAMQVSSLHKLQYFSVEENFPAESATKRLADSLNHCHAIYSAPPARLRIVEQHDLRVGANKLSPLPVAGFLQRTDTTSIGEVYHGDVVTFLAEGRFLADAWYFDGFSPAKNEAMWSEAVFARAFALTKSQGTFSTYSAAGWVRRNLQNAGFIVEKRPGFGEKREMLVGHKP